MQAMRESGIGVAGIRQQVDFSYKETFNFTLDLIKSEPNIRALWLQGSDRYQAALDGIAASGRRHRMLLMCFDAEPEFLDMISKKTLVGAAMQQPYLMGEAAVEAMDDHLHGRPVAKRQLQPVLPVSAQNLNELLPTIRRNVLGITTP